MYGAFAGLPWRAIGIVVAVAMLVGIGWTARGWRADAEISAIHRHNAEATALATQQAREREQVLADAIAMIDAEHTAERTKADEENSRLRAAVADGSQRLFVRVACPAGVPQAAAGAGLGAGTRAELSPDARPDYHALREGLSRMAEKLSACQAILAGERAETAP